ncbi:ferritin-like domain-containing protein [Patulibacter minatonensis]|uniref:ferritin-like domain-containing protein n=1 Tax=Patulibacter minatonensis TaxID=298163 RepID=UPI0004B66066|nr:ferritin-like domain-containing protein [Patulibacter minatonensis]
MPESLEAAAPLDEPRTPEERSSRRNLLRGLGLGSAGALAVVLSACGGDDDNASSDPPVTSQSPDEVAQKAATKKDLRIPGTGDLQIVNYALTLEYLEADFYAQVIDSGVVKDKKLGEMVKLFGEQEQTHVEALEKTAKQLGKSAGKPRTNFESVLAAGPAKVLETAAVVENLGAAAYLGQAGRIKDPDLLAAALSIHTVEARHAAALNLAAGQPLVAKGGLSGSLPDGPFATPLDMKAVLKRVQPFLA